jgi:8-oxo-dGTP pyrophosphatase MutT (NUDIX family)
VTIVPPAPDEPRRPTGVRDPGDAWVIAPSGDRYWGRFGAAGLLAFDRSRGVLLQHRVSWSHFGGTWGLPGGALHEGERAIDGAVREAQEEAGVPDGAVRPRFTSVLDLGVWSYTTVVADVEHPFDPVISDPESVALEWVPVDEVAERPLHPGFADAWPQLRALLDERVSVVVDAANVVGSIPDGWWKDRAGATARLRERLRGLAVPTADLDLGATEWFPEIALVVEGKARAVRDAEANADADGWQESLDASAVAAPVAVAIVRADAAGDDAIVAEVVRRVAAGERVLAVTSDRELADRLHRAGASSVRSAGWLRGLLDEQARRVD